MENTETQILTFEWGSFPVEYNTFMCTIISDTYPETLLNLLKGIYPEKIGDISLKNQSLGKKTFIFNCDDMPGDKWMKDIIIKRSQQFHTIISGKYQNIPKRAITMSDILIFDNEQNTNTYLEKNYKFNKIENYNFNKYYLVIDKRYIEKIFYGLERN